MYNSGQQVDIGLSVHTIPCREIMKALSLFLILNIIVCYSGLCASLPSFASVEQVEESCHTMDHDDTSYIINIVQGFNQTLENHSSCCFEPLINNTAHEDVEVYNTNIPRDIIPNLIIAKYDTKFKNRSLSKHDPPDLQVLNSTFLI
jgi:hypothetical protein